MNLQREMERLEALPLLGTNRVKAQELMDSLALRIDPNAQPELALRLLIRRFEASPTSSTTLAQLSTAESWAARDGFEHERVRMQLLWCTSVGRQFPDAVPRTVLDEAVRAAQSMGTLEAEWRLALATVQPTNASTLRLEALDRLTSPASDSVRITVLLDLAEDKARGSDHGGSLKAIQDAVNLAEQHKDPKAMCESLTRLGYALLNQGKHDLATRHLQRAFELARSEENDLATVITGTPLSAILLERGDMEQAGAIADRLLISGARRANWFAVVNGHITRSAILLASDDPTAAIERLVRAAVHLRELVPAAAINLLKGRLAELRHTIGPAVFDDHYRTAVERHRAS